MRTAATMHSSVPLFAERQPAKAKPIPAGLWRFLADRWLLHQESQMVAAVRALNHEGVLEDLRRASRG